VQAALADFITQGHFATHIRNVRVHYGQCRALLQQTLQQNLLPQAHLSNADTGLHLVIHLPQHCDDVAVAAEARQHQLDVRSLSAYYIAAPVTRGIVVGYGYLPLEQIAPSAQRLATLINHHISG
jgi:GntR family transcriptional regulator/MocR family aminotransferase